MNDTGGIAINTGDASEEKTQSRAATGESENGTLSIRIAFLGLALQCVVNGFLGAVGGQNTDAPHTKAELTFDNTYERVIFMHSTAYLVGGHATGRRRLLLYSRTRSPPSAPDAPNARKLGAGRRCISWGWRRLRSLRYDRRRL